MTWTLAFSPPLPVALVVVGVVLALLVAAAGLVTGGRGALPRALALALLALALFGPEIRREARERLPGVAVVVTDRSASQRLANRAAETEAARLAMVEKLKALPGLEIREAIFDDRNASEDVDGTRLFATLASTLSDVPPERVAGVVMLTDGQIHDVPDTAARLGFAAPLHVLLTGRPGEVDRRVEILEAPRFGLVGKPLSLAFKVVDGGVANPVSRVRVTVRRDGEEVGALSVKPGERATVSIDVAHAGPNIVEIEAEPLSGDLTALDDRAAVRVEGVRDHLKVLLVSGEPHPGERMWRNLLKSDAAVDLVHFTILRPPEKQDGTPVSELALIPFPTRELFQDKIRDFDLIVFDRYRRRGLLSALYFDNIARWVEDGGALLVAAEPDIADPNGVFDTALADVLPATPRAGSDEGEYRPQPTRLGRRHPVTSDLLAPTELPKWGHWYRQSRADAAEDAVNILAGPGDSPLLLLAERGKGRVGLLLSDQIWLWARGHDGGGPWAPLLRRTAHWLMKEPDLDAEALRITRDGRDLVVERRTLADAAAPVTLTSPTGETRTLTLAETAPGRWRAVSPADTLGLWRATDGTLTALTHVGPLSPREFADVLATDALVGPLAKATGGGVRRLFTSPNDAATLPRPLLREPGETLIGNDWIGLKASQATVLKGIDRVGLSTGLAALALVLALFAAAWWRESR